MNKQITIDYSLAINFIIKVQSSIFIIGIPNYKIGIITFRIPCILFKPIILFIYTIIIIISSSQFFQTPTN